MSRIVKEIDVEGRSLKALFDTGSLRSYLSQSPGCTQQIHHHADNPADLGLFHGTLEMYSSCPVAISRL